ncbi:hypothetical protein DACRYDRAFT_114221 [Dacryopinax primogenitus]|uniref:ABC transporter domain-containing protein n=1 Tax=Dacryopinax primogenitus (strain DJM 731) TaxID=1858805 RepID=M5G9H4_DACPD|nr:uncharacterized protein DACRYDRAFT_114221 [Dacryopinax primogenitus]EJU04900.1 hypothetical protein DACRYDRAFT_114221 [Dacryopinax primogenitus]
MVRALPLALLEAALVLLVEGRGNASTPVRNPYTGRWTGDYPSNDVNALSDFAPTDKCPPCFNCQLPAFSCGQYGECSDYDGQCKCPPGWGGIDCLTPLCDSLADGAERHLRPPGEQCQCKEGWSGINCNVCMNDNACDGFPLAIRVPPEIEDPGEGIANMTCYTGGLTVWENHQMCDVTNRKILDQLGERKPQATFTCAKKDTSCAFQFWVDQEESFYCALDTCKSTLTPGYENGTDQLLYDCDHVKCKCVPGKMLCGEEGSIDLSEFLTEAIKGPATFKCTGNKCSFEEPAMNELIEEVFGDKSITLACYGGECIHYTMVPGYERPEQPDNSVWVALSAAAAGVVFVLASILFWYLGRTSSEGQGAVRLPADEASKLMSEHVPASVHFSNLSYTVNGKQILENITGSVRPGTVMAIMGASGAGKSTLLDILARKQKRGSIGGTTLVNGKEVSNAAFRKVMGFVDQEDCLMPTLTVYETILYSALLRLPRDMSLSAKKYRTLETMQELGILGIKDSRIGESGKRSISGGEKRRVSIACELVTSPSILFLDEPTSGLDAFNAFNVIESLVTLAKDYNRTVIFTIHQPRSNIVALFDQLVLLAKGRMVYSGELTKCQDYFERIGSPCPPGFNIADYLIDLTMRASGDSVRTHPDSSPLLEASDDPNPNLDEEQGFANHTVNAPGQSSSSSTAAAEDAERQVPSQPEESAGAGAGAYIRHKTSQLLSVITATSVTLAPQTLSPELQALVDAYASSDIAAETKAEIAAFSPHVQNGVNGDSDSSNPDSAPGQQDIKSHRRASWPTQFRILSGRAFKNLYRNPWLLTTHYVSAIVIAFACGFFFYQVPNDIPGFQNRLGLFFFALALFGFSCLSSLGLFANERLLFMRERANGYYTSFTYFASKVLFDVLPLRVVPPMVFGGIVYGLVGLVPEVSSFWKFMLALVFFNLTTASVVLLLSIAIADTSVASLCGTLVMLFNLLFAGLLINFQSMPTGLAWIQTVSFFHAAYEALLVNELQWLQLKQNKYGIELDIPSATILSAFGFKANAYWWPDIAILGIEFGVFTILSYLILHYFVKERR